MGFETKKYNTSVADYELWALAHREREASKTPRFVTLSAIFHASALVFVAFMATPLVNDLKTETITIELEEVQPLPKISHGFDVPETQGPPPAPAEPQKVAEKISADDIVAPAPEPVKSLPAKAVPVKTLPEKAMAKAPKAVAPQTKAAAAPVAKSVAPKTNFQAVPATIDDIEAPELDNGALGKTPVVADDLHDDLSKDFAKVDQKNADELENEKRNLEQMTAAIASEQDENLKDLAEENAAEQARLAEAQEALRQKNADAIMAAMAAEKAEADAAAEREAARQAAALREAAAKRARAEAEAQALAASQGLGKNPGEGAGNNGATDVSSSALAGTPTGVRSLDQLRQMPGNPRPQYDREERRRGDQGEVAFVAYISKEGHPTQFRLMKSTGFRNLDAKTLSALKKWRFYPGQEGWVELPFRWDLKGGVQEDGGLLRRAVGSR